MAHLLHLSPSGVVVLLQILCYAVLFLVVFLLARRQSEWSVWMWALILSPATLGFHIIDHPGGYRKEILFFAGLALLLWMLRCGARDSVLILFLTLWVPFTTLAHESTFFYCGYYAAALLLHVRSWKRTLKIFLLPFLLGTIALVAVSLHPGTPQMAAAVCNSLKAEEPISCIGAIQDLGKTRADAHADLLQALRQYNYWLVYGITGSLALLPIVVMVVQAVRSRKFRFDAQVIVVVAAITLLVSLPLYYYAMDWGRWIYMHIMSLFLLLLFVDWEHDGLELPFKNMLLEPGFRRATAVVLLLLYSTVWTLPHLPRYREYFGYCARVENSKIFQSLRQLGHRL